MSTSQIAFVLLRFNISTLSETFVLLFIKFNYLNSKRRLLINGLQQLIFYIKRTNTPTSTLTSCEQHQQPNPKKPLDLPSQYPRSVYDVTTF